jgi:hypothetical protein
MSGVKTHNPFGAWREIAKRRSSAQPAAQSVPGPDLGLLPMSVCDGQGVTTDSGIAAEGNVGPPGG